MKWTDIIGHTSQVAMLRRMKDSRRMPHALLFAGSKGIGKSMVANVLAAALLCSSRSEHPCGTCHSCRQVSFGSHPDFLLIAPDGAAIKIEQIRSLQQEAAMAPYISERRVCVIDGAELMTAQAANSLLKVLEDPPGELIFILITANKQMLLTTILSRCLLIAFQPLTDELLTRALTDKGYLPPIAAVAARLSGGRMGIALTLLEPEGLALRNQTLEMLESLLESKLDGIWHWAAILEKMERNEVLEIIRYTTYILRDMLLLVTGQDRQWLFNIDRIEKLSEIGEQWKETGLVQAIRAAETARRALHANANIRLTSEALLITMHDLAKEA